MLHAVFASKEVYLTTPFSFWLSGRVVWGVGKSSHYLMTRVQILLVLGDVNGFSQKLDLNAAKQSFSTP